MDFASPIRLLKGLFKRPATVPPESFDLSGGLSVEDLEWLKRVGASQNSLKEALTYSTQINFERGSLYREIDRALLHWMVGGAVELYSDVATTYNQLHNSTVWVTGNKTYVSKLTKFFDDIGIEEKIFDWTWTTAGYGDHFVGVQGEPGVGIVSIDDDQHPGNISRIDYRNALVGFYKTPFESGSADVPSVQTECVLEAPWNWVHFRLLGAKRKRPLWADPTYTEFRTINLMGAETRQISSKYGTSILMNALPIYKRLRLAEDSILLARLTRGIMKYIYLIGVGDTTNMDAAAEITREYMNILKRARALNTDPNSPYFDSKSNPMSTVEDLFVPVFGDVNNIRIEKIGGEVDIRWIADIEELRNQLASALRCPLSLLGGYVQEASGALGSEAIGKLDIRFARNSRRVQRAIIEGLTRMAQIHLAYLNMDPDPKLFQINMSETSAVEEQELRDSMMSGLDVVDRFMDVLDKTKISWDWFEVLDYLNQKILKLNDMDLHSFEAEEPAGMPEEEAQGGASPPPGGAMGGMPGQFEEPGPEEEITIETPGGEKPAPKEPEFIERLRKLGRKDMLKEIKEFVAKERMPERRKSRTCNLDLIAALPLTEAKNGYMGEAEWNKRFSTSKVVVTPVPKQEEKKK